MIKTDEKSNAQSWELEVTCKNKVYLDEVVKAILNQGMIEFEVNHIDVHFYGPEKGFDGHYSVLLWSSWFSNLKKIADDLAYIEEKYGDAL